MKKILEEMNNVTILQLYILLMQYSTYETERETARLKKITELLDEKISHRFLWWSWDSPAYSFERVLMIVGGRKHKPSFDGFVHWLGLEDEESDITS